MAMASLDHKTLVDDELWDRLVARIVKDEGLDREMAERIMNEALGFLRFCADNGGRFAPSPLVDIGWHTFILYTRQYAEFCERVAGRFLHHEPSDSTEHGDDAISSPRQTMEAMQAAGFNTDPNLWHGKADCNCVTSCGIDQCAT